MKAMGLVFSIIVTVGIITALLLALAAWRAAHDNRNDRGAPDTVDGG